MLNNCSAFNIRYQTVMERFGKCEVLCEGEYRDGSIVTGSVGDNSYKVQYGDYKGTGTSRHATDLMKVMLRLNSTGLVRIKLTVDVGRYEGTATHLGKPHSPDLLLRLFDLALRDLNERSRKQDTTGGGDQGLGSV